MPNLSPSGKVIEQDTIEPHSQSGPPLMLMTITLSSMEP